MKNFRSLVISIITVFISTIGISVHAEKITIVAAADLKFAMDEIVKTFKKQNTSDEVAVIYGSSGKFFTQISQGAPFDLFFSADINYPRELVKSNMAVSDVTPYAIGRIVLWSASMDASKMTLNSLLDSKISKIAIASPQHAPYGKRAEEALRAMGIWEKIQPKLVYGESVAQTAQFILTENAQVGIIALSLAVNEELSKRGGYWLIPDNLHAPLEQGFVITKNAANNPLAKKFSQYMSGAAARSVMKNYGFVLPGELKGK